MHDSQVLDYLMASDNTASGVWTDSAYRSKDIEARIKATGLTSRIHRNTSRNRPLHHLGENRQLKSVAHLATGRACLRRTEQRHGWDPGSQHRDRASAGAK